ncbi:bacteriohemerythrin [Roseospirillum parvum]|uniref:Methyl-accepting chemotaxis protein/hemerythrin n=1 Tax=Roseospirillum parvum TaxID=83401 RepID=A0A1G8EVN5_9PROT|nr:bacteriohemerythrin [Roseospirillum parvum]SDH73857.1 methyl-accepting chemotaxis protein/hemerythrin [Roseospirillum parvum]
MSFLTWHQGLSVGHAALDFDHQTLINLINHLHETLTRGSDDQVIGTTIAALEHYVEAHFAREEAIMADAGYPDLEQHRRVHDEIRRVVADIADLHARAPRDLNHAEVLRFLKIWLLSHIQKADMRYAPYLAASDGDSPDSSG